MSAPARRKRLAKVLEDAGIKLAWVASDTLGVSGRAMLEALVAGTTDPQVLAELARGQLRKKLPALGEALEGRFGSHHALLVGEMLARIDQLDESIQRLSVEVARVLVPFSPLVALLLTISGVDRRTAEVVLAEVGPDMGRFPSSAHLASWAGVCPGNHESAGKHSSGRTRKGSKWLRTALVQAANAAARSRDTYLAAHDQRIKGRRGAPQGHRRGRPLHPGDRLALTHRQPAVLGPWRGLLCGAPARRGLQEPAHPTAGAHALQGHRGASQPRLTRPITSHSRLTMDFTSGIEG
jgi:transposase